MVAMRRNTVAFILVLFAVLVCLMGCAGENTPTALVSEEVVEPTEKLVEEAPTAIVEQTTEQAVVEPTAAEETEPTEEAEPEPTVEPTAEPTPEPTATPIVVVDVDSACVNCHTDVDRLKELAEEPEAVHLSSGEG